MSYSRASSGSNDIWQSPPYRKSSNFENIWSTSNRSSVSSNGGGPASNSQSANDWGGPQQLGLGVNMGPLDSNPPDMNGPGPASGYRQTASAPYSTTNGPRNPSWYDHRHSIPSFSPTFEMPDFSWDLTRRHSMGDAVAVDTNNGGTLDSINAYFEADPHKRVKVTVKLLEHNFFHDEQFLSQNYQLPKFPIESSLRNYQLVLVGFKAGRIDVFYLPNNAGLNYLKPGDLVIVEADRGKDLGKIAKMNISIDEARLLKFLQFQEQQQALHEDVDEFSFHFNKFQPSNQPSSPKSSHQQPSAPQPPTLHFPKSILSLAQPNEIVQILNKKQDEEKACRLCVAKISNTNYLNNNNLNDLLNMKLIDSEYQFDRKKLIFYYSTNKRIDFRDLVRELFRIYKTRIWMCAVVGIPYTPNQQVQPLQHQIDQSRAQHQIDQSRAQHPIDQGRAPPPPDQWYQLLQYQPFKPQSVPRPFSGTQENPPDSDRDSESLVLKSLVDQMNH